MIGGFEAFQNHVFLDVREVRAVRLDLLPCLAEVALVLTEQVEVRQHDIGVGIEAPILVEHRIGGTICQPFAHIDPETGQNPASGLHATFLTPVTRFYQSAKNMIFEKIGGSLGVIAEHLHVIVSLRRMREVVDHRRREYLYIVAVASINENVGFDLRHIVEEAVYVLRRDQPDLTVLNLIYTARTCPDAC